MILLAVAVAGGLAGCTTGLLPGLHVNTLAVLLVSAAPLASAALAPFGFDDAGASWVIAALVLAISVSHTFVNVLPGTYLGAPDPDQTTGNVLPGHRMLLRGHGFHAVRVNAYASYFAALASILLVWPVHWLLAGPPALWERIRESTPILLVAIAVFLFWREPASLGPPEWPAPLRRALGRLGALNLLLASGIYGFLVFRLPLEPFAPLPPSPLLPALGGLFGAATLIEALAQTSRVPHQFLRLADGRLRPRGALSALGVGVAGGAAMSLLPGLTNSTATALSSVARQGDDNEMQVSLGAVNTANAVFNLLVLYMFERARSGAVVALEALFPVDPWAGAAPAALLGFLAVTLAASWISLAMTLWMGRAFARRIHRVPYRLLVALVLAQVSVVVLVFSGVSGFVAYAVGAALGLVPVRAGLQRAPLTGVLLLPVLSYLWT